MTAEAAMEYMAPAITALSYESQLSTNTPMIQSMDIMYASERPFLPNL